MRKEITLFFLFALWNLTQINAQNYYNTYVDSSIYCRTCLVKFPVQFYAPDLYPQVIGEFIIESKSNFYNNQNILINYDTLSNQGLFLGKIDGTEYSFSFQLSEELMYSAHALELSEISTDYLPDTSSKTIFDQDQLYAINPNSVGHRYSLELEAQEKKVLNAHLKKARMLSEFNEEYPIDLIYNDVSILKWIDSMKYPSLKKIFKDSLSYLEYMVQMSLSRNLSTTIGYLVARYTCVLNGESRINWRNQPKTQLVCHWKNGILDGNYSHIVNDCQYGGNTTVFV